MRIVKTVLFINLKDVKTVKNKYDNWIYDILKCNSCGSEIILKDSVVCCDNCNTSYIRERIICFVKDLDEKDPVRSEDKQFLKKTERHVTGVSANDWNNESEWTSFDNRAELRMKKIIKYIDTEGIHLDIGIGRGDGTAYMANKKQTVGIEYGTLVAQTAKQNFNNVIQANASNLPFKDSVFNSITLLDSLEHILKPEEALREVYRVLKPEGRLLIQTPTKEGFALKKIGIFLNKPVVFTGLMFKLMLHPKRYMLKFKERKVKKPTPPQPIEFSRSRKYVKQMISQYFVIEKHGLINYWNKYHIIKWFSYSDIFICKRKLL